MLKTTACVAMLAAMATTAGAETWKPGAGPLMTRWAKDVSPENAHPEYPRPQMVRQAWLNLNGLWELAAGRPDQEPPLGVKLPGEILVPFPVESALSGVMRRGDRLWYRRTFETPEQWKGQRVLLHFGAVDWEATVYVNGKELGTHRGGYDAFSFDITDALVPGGTQEIVVRVFDPTDAGEQPRGKQVVKPEGIWYTPTTGIWQTVWLEPVPATHIAKLTMTPDVDCGALRLVVAAPGADDNFAVEAVAFDGKNEVARAFGGAGGEILLEIPRDRLKLWSPKSPALYDLTVTLKGPDGLVDEVKSYFGMRKIALGKDANGVTRIMLNGEFVFQMGPLDQGFWPDGLYTAPTDEALRWDIELTKELGFNMIRKHVKVEPARWYYWCDKLGMLVWQDMPSGRNRTPESKKQFELELDRMVTGLGNHPSIVMWVVFNEGWGQYDTQRVTQHVEKLDPSRLANNASGWTDKNVGAVIDMHNYPGPGSPKPEANRAAVLGEFGGLGLAVKGHLWTDKGNWGYRQIPDSKELTDRYVRLLRGVWDLAKSQGLSAAVYTQTTDVEIEINGLVTYDREVVKVDVPRVAAANQGRIPSLEPVVPSAKEQADVSWRYTFAKPADGWFQPGFDDAAWKAGPGGFGTKATPGAVVGTVWDGPEIWLRRIFRLPPGRTDDLSLMLHHDEDVEVYLNGVLAYKQDGFTTAYEEVTLAPAALAALSPGEDNVMAIHCRQTGGGQYVDAGLVRLVLTEASPSS
ncbi:MAG: glycoside hydrolase family 2 [Pirellulales bacterium]|nr:glycoside hydrolase family 2 [Pirellulales bacterium]